MTQGCATGENDAPEVVSFESLEVKRPGAELHRAARDCTRVANGIRTRDLRSHNPTGESESGLKSQAISTPAAGGCTGGCTTPPELARLVERWPTLPEHIQAAILTLANTIDK